jgi:hypothetical protein
LLGFHQEVENYMYRPSSVRNFKKFIGKLTATVAAIHISLCESENAEKSHSSNAEKGHSSYWDEASKRCGAVLSGVKTTEIFKLTLRISAIW